MVREWREGHLDLAGLPTDIRRFGLLASVAIAGSFVIIATQGFGGRLPGPTVEIPGRFLAREDSVSVAFVVIGLVYFALCVAAVGIAMAVRRSGRWLDRVLLSAVGFLAMSHGAVLVTSGRDLARLEPFVQSVVMVPASTVVMWCGLASLATGLGTFAVALLPIHVLRQRSFLTAVLPAIPFAFGFAAFAISAAYGPMGIGERPLASPAAYVAPVLAVGAKIVATWTIPIALWQTIAWARASRREVGVPLGRLLERVPLLLALLLGAKLAWLTVGYAGRLPVEGFYGGGSEVWEASRTDGPIAWLIAFVFAGAAGSWLRWVRKSPVSESGFRPAALLVVAGFSSVAVALSLLLPTHGLLSLGATALPDGTTVETACQTAWSTLSPFNGAQCLVDAAIGSSGDLVLVSQLATIGVALVLGVVLGLLYPRHRSAALFLAAVVLWVGPRALSVLAFFIEPTPSRPSHAPEVVTFDTALTLVIATLAVLWWRGRQRGATPAALILVLAISTLLAHRGTLTPSNWGGGAFVLALLFPVAYELFFDSEDLNAAGPQRAARVVRHLGVLAGVMSLVALGVVLDRVTTRNFGGELGYALFAVPFTAMLVAATLSGTSPTPAAPAERKVVPRNFSPDA